MKDAIRMRAYGSVISLLVFMTCLSGCIYRDTSPSQEEVIENYENKLEAAVSEFGSGHLETVSAIIYLASQYDHYKRFSDAELLYEQALEIYERELDPDDSRVGSLLYTVAFFYHDQGIYDKAEPLFQRGLNIHEYSYAPGYGSTFLADRIVNFANHYMVQEKYERAEPLLIRAIDMYEAEKGKNTYHIREPLFLLAKVYHATNRETEAVALEERAAKIHDGSKRGR
jgi:tetratricopeptide (TPR) repeat protein